MGKPKGGFAALAKTCGDALQTLHETCPMNSVEGNGAATQNLISSDGNQRAKPLDTFILLLPGGSYRRLFFVFWGWRAQQSDPRADDDKGTQ